MTHKYCSLCQSRLGSDTNYNHKLLDENLVKIVNISKPFIISQLKKSTNEVHAKSSDYIHKNCSRKAEYWFKTKYAATTNSDDFSVCSTSNSSSVISNNISLSSTTTKLTIEIPKAYSSHKQCFVCRSKNGSNKLVKISNDASLDILAKKNHITPVLITSIHNKDSEMMQI